MWLILAVQQCHAQPFEWRALQPTGIHVGALVVSLRSMKLASAAMLG
jgi:hypothetical protein